MKLEESTGLPPRSARLHRAGLWLQAAREAAWGGSPERDGYRVWFARWLVVERAAGVFEALCAVEWGEYDA